MKMKRAHFFKGKKKKNSKCLKCQRKEHYLNKCLENKPEKSNFAKKSSEGEPKSKEKTFAIHLSSQGITKKAWYVDLCHVRTHQSRNSLYVQ